MLFGFISEFNEEEKNKKNNKCFQFDHTINLEDEDYFRSFNVRNILSLGGLFRRGRGGKWVEKRGCRYNDPHKNHGRRFPIKFKTRFGKRREGL